MLIAVEGIDGAGKNTLVTKARTSLETHGISVTTMGFPAYGQTPFADFADAALHGKLGDTAESAWAMALLFALDRRDRREAIKEALKVHDVVILDRYVASNAAYSWARTGSRDIVEWIERTEFEEFGLPVPDLHVSVTTSVEVAGQRAQHREGIDENRVRDTYEKDSTLQTRTFEAYQQFVKEGWKSPWLQSTGDAAELVEHIEYMVNHRR